MKPSLTPIDIRETHAEIIINMRGDILSFKNK